MAPSAIYGTDAIGGVINFITKTDYEGIGLSGNVDITERGDGNIYRIGGIAGWGDLQEDGFNIMGAVSYRTNQILQGRDRDFTSGNQPNRGLSIDTRGTPYATIFNIGANAFQTPGGTLTQGLTLTAPNGANAAGGGINPLDLPGGAGCESMQDGMNYDFELWQVPTAFYACSFDTGRNVVIQQPIETLTYFGRAVADFSGHRLSFEVTGSDADSAKLFSQAQYSGNATNLPIAYPLNARTAATYNAIYDQLAAAFVSPGLIRGDRTADGVGNYGRPIAFRWRCVICGQREYTTNSKTFRVSAGLEGPIFDGWDYRAGASYAKSENLVAVGPGLSLSRRADRQ
jgi:iron complex outermembrane receptor protein